MPQSEIFVLVEILAVAMTATILAAILWSAWIYHRWLGGLKVAVSDFGHRAVERADASSAAVAAQVVEQMSARLAELVSGRVDLPEEAPAITELPPGVAAKIYHMGRRAGEREGGLAN